MSSHSIYVGRNFDPQIWYKRNKRNPLGKEIASYDKCGRGYTILDLDKKTAIFSKVSNVISKLGNQFEGREIKS